MIHDKLPLKKTIITTLVQDRSHYERAVMRDCRKHIRFAHILCTKVKMTDVETIYQNRFRMTPLSVCTTEECVLYPNIAICAVEKEK